MTRFRGILLIALLSSSAAFSESLPDSEKDNCERLISASKEKFLRIDSHLLPRSVEYSPGLLVPVDENGDMQSKFGDEYELPTSVVYAKYLQQQYGFQFLLLPTSDGRTVPAYDGIIFDADGYAKANVSLKSLVVSKNLTNRGAVRDAISSVRKAQLRDDVGWGHIFNVPAEVISEQGAGYRKAFDQKFLEELYGRLLQIYPDKAPIKFFHWICMEKFLRIFDIRHARATHVVITLLSDIEFPNHQMQRKLQYKLIKGAQGVSQITIIKNGMVLEISAHKIFKFHL